MTALKVIFESTSRNFSAFWGGYFETFLGKQSLNDAEKCGRSILGVYKKMFCNLHTFSIKTFFEKVSKLTHFWQHARGTLFRYPRTRPVDLSVRGYLICWTREEVARTREKNHNLTFKWRVRLFNLIFRLSLRDLSWVIIFFFYFWQFSRFFSRL